jgi:hypothetical protein
LHRLARLRHQGATMNVSLRRHPLPVRLKALMKLVRRQDFMIDDGRHLGVRRQTPAPFWLYYFNVEAVDSAMARVKTVAVRSS